MILVHCKFQGRMVFVVVSLFHCFVFFGGEVARVEGNRQGLQDDWDCSA